MIIPQQHIDIEWPLTALFHYIADIENNTEWQSEVVNAEWIIRNEHRVGCTYNEVKRINEEEVNVMYTVSELVPYQKRTVSNGSASFTLQFEPIAADCTRLHVTVSQPDDSNVHPLHLLFNDLNKLKNILEEVYC